MPDVFTQAKRSEVMSRIRSRGNRDTELALAKLLRAHGVTGWRRHERLRLKGERVKKLNQTRRRSASPLHSFTGLTHSPTLTVRPDFVFRRARLAVFVDGCFWHGCPKHGTRPKGNAAFWRKKFTANRARDQLVNRTLRRAGWRVLRVWEHELRKAGKRKGRGDIQRSTPTRREQAFNSQRRRKAEGEAPPVVRRIQRALG